MCTKCSAMNYMALNNLLAAVRKDFMLCSDLHFGGISLWMRVLCRNTCKAWRRCVELLMMVFSLETVVLSATSAVSILIPVIELAFFYEFVQSVSISSASTLPPAHHKEQSTGNDRLFDSAQQGPANVKGNSAFIISSAYKDSQN